MRRGVRVPAALAATAALLMGAAGPASASPCWAPTTIGAARINELNTLLMTASLRCKRIGVNFGDAYEQVLHAHHGAFAEAEQRIKAHFGVDHSDSADDYDSYVVSIANTYGTGRADPQTCAQLAALANALAGSPGNTDLLATVAIQMVRDPHAGQRCAGKAVVRTAGARTAPSATPGQQSR